MAAHSGPNCVENGLILSLDAGSRKSYPGSGTVWTNLVGTGINGTLTNGPTFNSTNEGAIVFDGTNDFVDCGNIIQGRTTFSADVFMKSSDTRTGSNSTYMNPVIFGAQHGSGLSGDFSLNLKAGKLGFYHELNSNGYVDTNVTIADNNWHYVVVTKSTAGAIILYVDGVQVYSGTGFTSSIRTSDLQFFNWELGRAYWYGEDASMMRYNGMIASHRFYTRDITAAEVRQNFVATKTRFNL